MAEDATTEGVGGISDPDHARQLRAVEERLFDLLAQRAARPPLTNVARHLVEAGGKRLRPRLLLAAAPLARVEESHAVHLACAAELIHSASLLHDDVVDEADIRRGRPAARAVWGNKLSVLAGDFLLASAMSEVEKVGRMEAISSLNATVRSMIDSEVLQLAPDHSSPPSRELYEEIVTGKTASLFAWCTSVAGLGSPELTARLHGIGLRLGVAFQIIDDVLDYEPSLELGKPSGQDLEEGKITLPLIEALEAAPELWSDVSKLLGQAPSHLSAAKTKIIEAVKEVGGTARARQRACALSEEAKALTRDLAASPSSALLEQICELIINRSRLAP